MPYYLCENGKIKVDGKDLIDIRFSPENECESYFVTCCDLGNVEKTVTSTVTLPPPLGCGYRNVDGVRMRITGDEDHESQFGEFPWMVAILKTEEETSNKFYACGGSLIHAYVVLTGKYLRFTQEWFVLMAFDFFSGALSGGQKSGSLYCASWRVGHQNR